MNALCCDTVDDFCFFCLCKVRLHLTTHLSDFLTSVMSPNILKSSSYLFPSPQPCCTSTNGPWPKEKKQQPSNGQSVKLTRLASLSEEQASLPFEGRIGWGSCKLPNKLSAHHCTVLEISVFPVYLDHISAFDADPSPGWVTSWNSACILHFESWWTDTRHTQKPRRHLHSWIRHI